MAKLRPVSLQWLNLFLIMVDLGLAKRLAKEKKEKERQDAIRKEKAIVKAEALRKKEEARIKAEEEARFWAENEELRLEMEREKFEASEVVRKTKVYWKLNDYNNEKTQIAMNPTYFGEHITDHKNDAWVPHGPGKFLVGDEPIITGTYHKGYLHGQTTHEFEVDDRVDFRLLYLYSVDTICYSEWPI